MAWCNKMGGNDEIAGKAFGSPHNLEVHNIVHTGYKPYICRVCGKAFARKAEIRDHERTHTGEKPYQCEFCGATFRYIYLCACCSKRTKYRDNVPYVIFCDFLVSDRTCNLTSVRHIIMINGTNATIAEKDLNGEDY